MRLFKRIFDWIDTKLKSMVPLVDDEGYEIDKQTGERTGWRISDGK